jgi:hypothetical protein
MDIQSSLTKGFGVPSGDIRDAFSGFGNNRFLSGSAEFLQSNTLVAKIAFIFLVVIVFVILLRLGTRFVVWLTTPNGNPKLIPYMKDGTKPLVIKQDPKLKDSITLLRSNNEHDGLEFTYSTWLNIKDTQDKLGKYGHIFHKGNDSFQEDGLSLPNNAPGLYLDKDTNKLVIIMNTFNNVIEKVEVPNIPLNKWISVIIRVEGAKMDVYINGTITLRHQFTSVPKQNYGDLYVNLDGGFQGYISDLWYHNYSLTTRDIINIVDGGPNLKTDTSSYGTQYQPPYFSLRWYTDK